MTNDPRLERYLTSLERALMSFPVSDRAEIITEIKSHVFSALERDPQTRLDTVLAALGEPETVANRYLMERGMKPAKTSISPIVKWLTIGFLGTVAMVLVFAGFVLTRFDSLVKIDGKHGRVQVLGGMIDINGDKDRITLRASTDTDSALMGTQGLNAGETLAIRFANGKIQLGTSQDNKFNWACKTDYAAPKDFKPEVHAGIFDLTPLQSLDCELEVPTGSHVTLNGRGGKIELEAPRFDIAAELGNGKIEFQPAEKADYKFDVSVDSGKMDEFSSSKEADAHSVKIHVGKGLITNKG